MSDTPPYSEATVELVTDATEQHYLSDGQTDAMGNSACSCGQWWDAAGDNPGWDQHMAEVALGALAAAGRLLPEGAEQRTDYGVEFAYPGHEPKTLLEPSRWVAEQTVALGAVGHAHAERRLMQRTSWSTGWSAVPPEPKEDA